jgi:hypothetical protein
VDKYHKTGAVTTDAAMGYVLGGQGKVGTGSRVPGLDADLGVEARVQQRLALTIDLNIELLEIIAGPTGQDNGVRWMMYRQSSALVKSQAFLQVISLPEADVAKPLQVQSKAWTRTFGFFGIGSTTQWKIPARPHSVIIEKG